MSPYPVYAAFYRGRAKKRFSLARLGDWLTRRVTRGPYSHCEIAVAIGDGLYRCYSSSFRDGGVRIKTMPLPGNKWDLISLDIACAQVMTFHDRHIGKPYDWRGVLGFVFYNRDSRNKWFCSEYCAAALGFSEAWRISPSLLHALLESPVLTAQRHQFLKPD